MGRKRNNSCFRRDRLNYRKTKNGKILTDIEESSIITGIVLSVAYGG